MGLINEIFLDELYTLFNDVFLNFIFLRVSTFNGKYKKNGLKPILFNLFLTFF